MRVILMLFLMFPIQAFAGPYQDAQQFGQAAMDTIPGSISNGNITNQSVPGYQTSNPPEAQLNNQAALNNAAMLGTANDASGAGQFIYNSNANNATFTFSPNDPLITGSNQIQADAYTTMSALNPSNAGATTCVDIVTNTTGIVDTYTCNQSRPNSTLTCSKSLNVRVNSNSSCILGSLLKTVQMGRFSVKVYCNPLSKLNVTTTIKDYYPAKNISISKNINPSSRGSIFIGTDIVWTKGKAPYTSCRWSYIYSKVYSAIAKNKDSGVPASARVSSGGHFCGTLTFTPVYFDYVNTCKGSSCTLYAGGRTLSYSLQHTVYSFTDTWSNYLCK